MTQAKIENRQALVEARRVDEVLGEMQAEHEQLLALEAAEAEVAVALTKRDKATAAYKGHRV